MKPFWGILFALLLGSRAASAAILPPSGVDEAFRAWTGLECTPAVVLCESLSVLDSRGDQGGKKVNTLFYSGKTIPVIESWDGYAKIYDADGSKTGWVRSEYLILDPAWYVCDEAVQVYAFPDSQAPRVAYLEKGEKLPVLTEYEDAREWVCVSLRGAAGWIRKTPADTAGQTGFHPGMLNALTRAQLVCGTKTMDCTDKAVLEELSVLLTNAEDRGSATAGCPFTAALKLTLSTGEEIELLLAADSCCTYRINGRDYAYARTLWNPEEGSPENDVLFRLFGVTAQEL